MSPYLAQPRPMGIFEQGSLYFEPRRTTNASSLGPTMTSKHFPSVVNSPRQRCRRFFNRIAWAYSRSQAIGLPARKHQSAYDLDPVYVSPGVQVSYHHDPCWKPEIYRGRHDKIAAAKATEQKHRLKLAQGSLIPRVSSGMDHDPSPVNTPVEVGSLLQSFCVTQDPRTSGHTSRHSERREAVAIVNISLQTTPVMVGTALMRAMPHAPGSCIGLMERPGDGGDNGGKSGATTGSALAPRRVPATVAATVRSTTPVPTERVRPRRCGPIPELLSFSCCTLANKGTEEPAVDQPQPLCPSDLSSASKNP